MFKSYSQAHQSWIYPAICFRGEYGGHEQWSNYEGARGTWPPERPGGPLETPGLREYKGASKRPPGASKRPPEISRHIQYMIATYQYHSKHQW